MRLLPLALVYWSSHFIYHVPRDVAYDMLLADKKYITPFKK